MNAARKARIAEARTWAGFRQAHYARTTGALVVVLDDREAGLDSGDCVGRWVTLCDDHDRLVFHETLETACSQASDPGGWCGVCNGSEPADEEARASCPDGGTCHHGCDPSGPCWRVANAGPLSGVYPRDVWPEGVA